MMLASICEISIPYITNFSVFYSIHIAQEVLIEKGDDDSDDVHDKGVGMVKFVC